jgi:hypothetical protein
MFVQGGFVLGENPKQSLPVITNE